MLAETCENLQKWTIQRFLFWLESPICIIYLTSVGLLYLVCFCFTLSMKTHQMNQVIKWKLDSLIAQWGPCVLYLEDTTAYSLMSRTGESCVSKKAVAGLSRWVPRSFWNLCLKHAILYYTSDIFEGHICEGYILRKSMGWEGERVHPPRCVWLECAKRMT